MRRLSWGLLVALLLTNAFWIVREFRPAARPPKPPRSPAGPRLDLPDLRDPEGPTLSPGSGDTGATEGGTTSGAPAIEGPASGPTAVQEQEAAMRSERDRLVEGAIQVADAALRDSCIAEILAALESDEPERIKLGAYAVARIGSVSYPRERARSALSRALRCEDPDLLTMVLIAIPATAMKPGDLDRLVELASSVPPEARGLVIAALSFDLRGDFTAPAVDAAVTRLLSDVERTAILPVVRALPGTTLSLGPMNRLLELARDEDSSLRYHALETLASLGVKTDAVVLALLDVLEGPDISLHHPIVRGLRKGVPDASRRRVADVFAKLMLERMSKPTILESIEMLEHYGDAAHAPALMKVARNPELVESLREHARRSAAVLQARR